MYALCNFSVPGIIAFQNRSFSSADTKRLADYFIHYFNDGQAELISVYEFEGEIEDGLDDSIPVPSTFLTVSIELDSETIQNWERNEGFIKSKVFAELQNESLHLSSYVNRDDETRIYFIKDYD